MHSGIASKTHMRELEILALAMNDSRLADYVGSNKSFTLSKVHGFMQTSGPREVGTWLAGRLVTDSQGDMWHVPRHKRIAIRSVHDISRVLKAGSSSNDVSDLLGRYIVDT